MGRTPPSAGGSLLLGCARQLQHDQLGTYAEAMAAHGDIARFRVGPPRFGFEFDAVFSPEGAHQVLAGDAGHYVKDAPVIGEFRHFLGDGLLVSRGERWLSHRRIAQPLFTRRAVTSHLEAIAAATGDLLSWCEADAAAGTPVDLHALSMRYALAALGRSVFGKDIAQVAPTLRDVLPPLGDHLKHRALSPFRSPHWFPSPANRRGERMRKVVWDLADSLIADRRATGTEGTDLLSRLLSARDPDTGEALSDADVRDEVIIFLIAGHETTGSALAFTLHLLGRHQEVQDRVRAEAAEAAVSVRNGAPTVHDVERLPYTVQVINEAMRLYPPAHTVVRRAEADTELLGYPVQKGRIVAVSIWGVHHRPTVWAEPFEFSPERQEVDLSTGVAGRRPTPYRQFPFGGGPRKCIGEHLAMAELAAAVAALLGRYRLRSLLEVPEVEVDLALRPRGTLPCRFEIMAP
ncbi:MAG TPA: cytochrome P450 [Acidimicrobiales bacterium]|nr:cytochrome P450 [Acidimicrobiales bacterium]